MKLPTFFSIVILIALFSTAARAQTPLTANAWSAIPYDKHTVLFFDGPNFTGRQVRNQCTSLCNYHQQGMNFRAVSCASKVLCSEINLKGDCRKLGQGDYANTDTLFPAALYKRVVFDAANI